MVAHLCATVAVGDHAVVKRGKALQEEMVDGAVALGGTGEVGESIIFCRAPRPTFQSPQATAQPVSWALTCSTVRSMISRSQLEWTLMIRMPSTVQASHRTAREWLLYWMPFRTKMGWLMLTPETRRYPRGT